MLGSSTGLDYHRHDEGPEDKDGALYRRDREVRSAAGLYPLAGAEERSPSASADSSEPHNDSSALGDRNGVWLRRICRTATGHLSPIFEILEALYGSANRRNQMGPAQEIATALPSNDVPLELSEEERRRYSRHIMLPEIGRAGQEKLKVARVLCLGAGGLGSPAALYLAAAGVGTLGIVDDDHVALSNLHRQLLHGTSDIGRPKTDSARKCKCTPAVSQARMQRKS
jgi:ThiF family